MPVNNVTIISVGMNFAMAIISGLAIGIERQYSNREKNYRLCGIRDYMLIAVLAFISSLFYTEMPVVWILAFGTVVLYSLVAFVFEQINAKPKQSGGLTSIIVMPVTFLIASLPNFNAQFWVLATILLVVLLFLSMKTQFHTFAESIDHREIGDFAILIAIAISITPLIPADAQIPIPLIAMVEGAYKMHYNYISMAMLWKVVTMVSLMSFSAYFITKYIKGRDALVLATFFGGLVSSLATIILLLRPKPGDSHKQQLTTPEIFLGYISASTGSILKDLIVFRLVIGEQLFESFIFPMASALVLFFGISAYVYFNIREQARKGEEKDQEFSISERPLPLSFVFKFSGIFAALIFVMNMVTFYLGDGATVFASFGAGMISSAAALGSLGTSMLQGGNMSLWVSCLAVVAALTGSIFAKYIVIARKLGLRQSFVFVLPITSLIVIGLSTTWLTFQNVQ